MMRNRNEFFAMGFPADESAVDLAIKAELAAGIAKYLQDNDMAQSEAATLFNVPQPVISKITTGNLEKLSVTYLWRLLFRMKQPVRACTGTHPDHTIVQVGGASSVALTSVITAVGSGSGIAMFGTGELPAQRMPAASVSLSGTGT